MKTQIICVLDKSGSMYSVIDDTIGGFNAFLEEQKALPGKARLSLLLFDGLVEKIHTREKVKDVPALDRKTYVIGGSTALVDALGAAIEDGEAHEMEQNIVLTITDGHENASSEYSLDNLRARIKGLTESGKWNFQFLGANIDAFAAGRSMGVMQANTVNAGQMSPEVMRNMAKTMSTQTTDYRTRGETIDASDAYRANSE